jgi:hypothetical protein
LSGEIVGFDATIKLLVDFKLIPFTSYTQGYIVNSGVCTFVLALFYDLAFGAEIGG